MPWQVIVHKELSIIETVYSGLLSPDELKAAVCETGKMAHLYGTGLLLGDCSALVGGHSVVDLYYLADAVRENEMSFTLKEAVILPELPESKEFAEFWETTSVNRGLLVRLFKDRKSAIDWLVNPSASQNSVSAGAARKTTEVAE